MSGKRVMAAGVFDLLHAGHLHYLEQAKVLYISPWLSPRRHGTGSKARPATMAFRQRSWRD